MDVYNLDMVISVGYRVNSKKATEFRKWATNVINNYIVQGYALHEKRLKQLGADNLNDVKNALSIAMHAIEKRSSSSDEAISLLKVIQNYSIALDLLDRYDHETLEVKKSNLSKRKVKVLSYAEAISIVKELANTFGASSLFGKEKDKSFKSSIEEFIKHLLEVNFTQVLKKKQRICFIF